MLRYLFDTDHLTLFENGHPSVARRLTSRPPVPTPISVVTIEKRPSADGWRSSLVRQMAQQVYPLSSRDRYTSVPGFNLNFPATLDVVKAHFQSAKINQGERPRRVDTRGRNDRAGIDDQSIGTPKPHRLMGVADDQ